MTHATAAELNSRFGNHHIIFKQSPLGGIVAELTGGGSTTVVALQGAQVLDWTPDGGAPVLWLSPAARLGTGKPLRGGVPVCWPWFGPHPQAGRPSHGFVRAAPWQVIETSDNGPGIRLCFDTRQDDVAGWPFASRLTLTVTAGAALTLTLNTENLGTRPFEITQALHSYFAVGDITRVSIEGLEHRRFIDQLDGGSLKTNDGPIRFAAELDRIYQDTRETCVIVDPVLSRRISIAKSGSGSTVVWNPWSDKADRLGDLGGDGWRLMVCIETANAGGDRITVAPGVQHDLTASISVAPL